MIKFKPIKEIAILLKTGKTPPSKERKYFDGELNWYTPGDLDKSKYLNCSARKLTTLAVKESKVVLFPKGTLLIGCIGDIGKIGITTIESSSNQQITGIYPKEDTDVSYLYYWFKANKHILVEHSNNAVVPILNNRTLEKIEIPLPPFETQKKIAATLDAADNYRQKTKLLIEKYDELAQSLFFEMFGDPVRNEKGWDKIQLQHLGNISSGSTPSRKEMEYYVGEIPWVKTGEVNGEVIIKTNEKISIEALNNSSCRLYPAGSIIIAMYGQGKTRGKVGMLGIEATTNQACAVIPPSSKMNYIFLLQLLKLNYNELRNMGRGGNQPNLNVGIVKNYEIINPKMYMQNQFAQRIQAIQEQKAQAQQALAKSEYLFNSLLQKAFSGELLNN